MKQRDTDTDNTEMVLIRGMEGSEQDTSGITHRISIRPRFVSPSIAPPLDLQRSQRERKMPSFFATIRRETSGLSIAIHQFASNKSLALPQN